MLDGLAHRLAFEKVAWYTAAFRAAWAVLPPRDGEFQTTSYGSGISAGAARL